MSEAPTNHIPEKSDEPGFIERFVHSKWYLPVILSVAAVSTTGIIYACNTMPQRADEAAERIAEAVVKKAEKRMQNEINLAVARAMADQLDFELPPGVDGETAIEISAEILAIRSMQQALESWGDKQDSRDNPATTCDVELKGPFR